ncbi:MAG: hypothetical protein GY948_24785 [Alphaproteobacteria bacterium]|nr:hypothetical protein [Alphaproteobacteria bacterium]
MAIKFIKATDPIRNLKILGEDTDYGPDPHEPVYATGMAIYDLKLKGKSSGDDPARHGFEFFIPLGYTPRDAVVQLSLINIYNKMTAKNMLYELEAYKAVGMKRGVRVRGIIHVGDSDGYLKGLSYTCIATARYARRSGTPPG